MNIDNIFSKVESHAEALGIIASVYSRTKEGDMPQGIIGHFTDWSPNGQGIGAILKADTDLDYLQTKLFHSNHLYSLLIKLGGALWLAGELDVPYVGKYKNLGWKLLKSGVISAIVLPGSGSYGANPSASRRDTTLPTPNPSTLTSQIRGAF